MKTRTILYLCNFLFCVGCAESPMATLMMSPEELTSASDEQICDAYASFKADKLRAELRKRDLFTEKEWHAIEENDFYVGMSKKALIASRPNLYLTGISSIRDYGMCEIYGEFGTSVNLYIYVQQGKVVAVQMY